MPPPLGPDNYMIGQPVYTAGGTWGIVTEINYKQGHKTRYRVTFPMKFLEWDPQKATRYVDPSHQTSGLFFRDEFEFEATQVRLI